MSLLVVFYYQKGGGGLKYKELHIFLFHLLPLAVKTTKSGIHNGDE